MSLCAILFTVLCHRHHSFWALPSTALGDISICHTWNLSLWNYLLLFLAIKMVGIMGGGRTYWVRNETCIYGHVLFHKGQSCSCFCKPWWESVEISPHYSLHDRMYQLFKYRNAYFKCKRSFHRKINSKRTTKKWQTQKIPSLFSLLRLFKYVLVNSW